MVLRFESIGLLFSILTEHCSFQRNNTNLQCKNGRNYGNKIKIVYFVVVYQFQNSLGLILLILGLGGVFGFNLFWAQKVIRIIEQFFTRGFDLSFLKCWVLSSLMHQVQVGYLVSGKPKPPLVICITQTVSWILHTNCALLNWIIMKSAKNFSNFSKNSFCKLKQ